VVVTAFRNAVTGDNIIKIDDYWNMFNRKMFIKDMEGKVIAESFVPEKIKTIDGTAHYIGTEIENKQGRWNQSYATRNGYWVIHDGDYHHIYKVTR